MKPEPMDPWPLLVLSITLAAGWTLALIGVAALLWLLGADSALRDGLGDVDLRARPEGAHTVAAILARNLPIAGLALVAAWAVPRRPDWRLAGDIYVIATAALTLLTAAAALATFGSALTRYALPFAPLEIGGFALAVSIYATCRRRPPVPTYRLLVAGATVALVLLAAAVAEARWGGVL